MRSRGRLFAGIAAGVFLLVGCARQGASEQGQEVHNLYLIILALGGFVFILVEGLLLWSIVRYRKRDDQPAPQTFGSTRALIGFFAFGAVLVAVLFPFGERALSDVESPEPPGVNIRIEAFQWEWTALYPDEGIFSTGKTLKQPLVMEVPVDLPVHFTLVSRDVMHGFFLRDFLFMRNAIPGHPNHFTFTPNKIGTFRGQCTEFCGLWHSRMTLVLKVVAPTDYAAWVKQQTLKAIGGTCSPHGTDVRLTAKNTSWNTNCIAVPRGSDFNVTIANLDEGVDHNFAIYPSLSDGISEKHELFESGKFAGIATRSFQVTQTAKLPPGHYYFQCNVHGVAMAGAFIVK
jgi:cytochrome c oxidase subunit II